MTAIAVYSWPSGADDPVSRYVHTQLGPQFTPYVQMTSQWQSWSLFGEDPLRRVEEYAIEIVMDGKREELTRISPATVPPMRRAVVLKTLRRLTDSDVNSVLPEHFLQLQCAAHSLPVGTTVILKEYYFVLPHTDTIQAASFWRTWNPEWSAWDLATIECT